ncbi:TlyA family rRNA (cytidine-2'-O)-methyltransferase [Aestuariivirga litoralis]|uniref:TlyA family rRNA (cytidine-2'-O)-methyltransferase n=1 Tax=Aestuariivirga litoralis TaxID=2650924 RepID=UPI0018C6A2E0|nr:TlyA family RNA methyltransferase [Aestuariivirga litoralis]
MSKLRLDEALVVRGLYPSRARARDAVMRGTVLVNEAPARKPSQNISEEDKLRVHDKARDYVSRAALKLIHALDHFNIEVDGRRCLDLGASTGGFSQVLLERGASQVIAIEVGHGQMMLQDERLDLREGVNARDLTRDDVPDDVSLVVCDVSFIPLHIALGPALELATEGSHLVALIKPQFEVGRDALGKGGIVREEHLQQQACDDVAEFIRRNGWRVLGVTASPMEGGDGNREFLIAAHKG